MSKSETSSLQVRSDITPNSRKERMDFISRIKESVRQLEKETKNGTIKSLIRRTDKTEEGKKTKGIASRRSSHYVIPDLSEDQIRQIDEERKRIDVIAANIVPDEVLFIKRGGNWKPFRVELYGITDQELVQLGKESYNDGKLVKIASIHGASHSVALVERLLDDEIAFDFCYFAANPVEMEGETAYVKYIARHVHNLPLIITNLQETAEEIYYKKKAFPSVFKRWCTRDLKLVPYKAFLRKYFHDTVPKGSSTVVLQFLGIQREQSTNRNQMVPTHSLSALSLQKMSVFETLPIFNQSHEDNRRHIIDNGITINCNEQRYGRHGCLACVFSGWRWFAWLKENEPDKYALAIFLRNEASRYGMEKAYREAITGGLTEEQAQKLAEKKRYIVYPLNRTMKKEGWTESPY